MSNVDLPHLARRQMIHYALVTLFLTLLLAAFVYQVRSNDLSQIRNTLYHSCQVRNTNTGAVQDALQLLSGQVNDPAVGEDLRSEADRLAVTDCGSYLH